VALFILFRSSTAFALRSDKALLCLSSSAQAQLSPSSEALIASQDKGCFVYPLPLKHSFRLALGQSVALFILAQV
ncbi:hypothetical protein KTI87_06360, partial [Acinetobacter nosocomialis]|uniref:hypothetical protein n=1 Tax=Acinetobacter nosocomialis TaxID=106654 RepID=UPI0021D206CC